MIRTYYMDVSKITEGDRYESLLAGVSPYRQEKCNTIRTFPEKRRSLGAALTLDAALQEYGIREKEADYTIGEKGKPYLKEYPAVCFSLSHSGDYAICSIGNKELGCDVERIKDMRMNVAERFFTDSELAYLHKGRDASEVQRRMFAIWTRKESYLKAIGTGLSLSTRTFDVVTKDGAGAIVRDGNEQEVSLKEYIEIPGYCITVCCLGREKFAKDMICVDLNE